MSWSTSAFGKPSAVSAKITADLTQYKCTEPEESVKQSALVAIQAALSAQSPTSCVRVEASGSQSGNAQSGFLNTLNIKIDPLYGFVE